MLEAATTTDRRKRKGNSIRSKNCQRLQQCQSAKEFVIYETQIKIALQNSAPVLNRTLDRDYSSYISLVEYAP